VLRDVEDSDSPLSTIIVNRENGSRTILHYRGTLAELTAPEFVAVYAADIAGGHLRWIHFEGFVFVSVFS
jgi:sugar/nucleoside kinase (ribokinase family)